MEETRHLFADPSTGPFVRYGGGYAVFPPNDLRTPIGATLDLLANGATLEAAWKTLVNRAWIGGEDSIHPASTWYCLALDFVGYYERHFSKSPEVTTTALKAARLMLTGPIDDAWEQLQAFLIECIDVISGWSSSWIREDAVERGVIRRDDGTYWYTDTTSGLLIRITGTKTLPETRLDFITDAIVRPWGSVREVLKLFALLATSDDFRRTPSSYPQSMRLAIHTMSDGLSFDWHRRNHHEVRTVKWRPYSNLCDPEWLAQVIAARVVDATSRDIWLERVEAHRDRPSGLESDYTRQMDYILDSELLIGNEDEVYLTFEGRTFRWINGTPESRATLTVGCKDAPASVREAEQAVDRFLSFLVWEHGVAITKLWGAGGPRRSLPIAWEPRMSGGSKVSVGQALSGYAVWSKRRWLALALHREGMTSRSMFYRFLSFWKILELAMPDMDKRIAWVNGAAAKLGGAPAPEIPIYDYLEVTCRDAIAHVSLGPLRRRRRKKRGGHPLAAESIDPDNHEHRTRIDRDAALVRDLARMAIRDGLTD